MSEIRHNLTDRQLVSIIVPVYNVEKYLEKCVNSILAQTYTNIEVILIDDGSTDKCPQICDEYACKNKRVNVVHQKNSGVSAARNTGLKIARGTYVGFVDPDDWIDTNMYEILVEKIETSQAELAICGYNRVKDNDYHILETSCLEDKVISSTTCISDLFSLDGYSIRPSVWNKLFIKEIIADQRFDVTYNISEDLLFLTSYLLKINKVAYVNNAAYHNLKREFSSTCGGGKLDDICKTVTADYKVYSCIKRKYPFLRHVVLSWIIQDNMGWYRTISGNSQNRKKLKEMKRSMIKTRIIALFNKDTYWKTRIAYFFGLF